MEAKGIDVSYFQGDINWQEVPQSNITFAMIRATYGTAGVDSMFMQNMQGIKETNIYPGAYHYCYALTPQEAINEANHFINIIKPYSFSYPLALDIEEASIAELGKDAVTEIITSFIDTLKAQNYYPILFVNRNWLENYIDTQRLSDLDIWLSDWGSQPPEIKNVTMWQFSSEGRVTGIDGNVDMDISYKDYPSIIRQQNSGNDDDTNSDDDSQTEDEVSNPLVYKVIKGDSLWSIAQRFLGDGNKYREIFALNNLTSDIIYPGQLLRIPRSSDNDFVVYRVRQGDTLWNIAQRFLGNGNRYPEIINLNGLSSDRIYAGQLLRVPVESENVTISYTVQKSDTLYGIARRFLGNGSRYTDIMALNNLSNNVIYPGEQLKIPSR